MTDGGPRPPEAPEDITSARQILNGMQTGIDNSQEITDISRKLWTYYKMLEEAGLIQTSPDDNEEEVNTIHECLALVKDKKEYAELNSWRV